MASGRDIGFEPSILSKLSGDERFSVAQRFQQKALELAKQGIFGAIRTRKSSLQNSYALLVSLLDNTMVPVLIYGEPGSGKHRHVNELLTVHNFHRRLEGKEFGKIKVFKGDYLAVGFSRRLFRDPHIVEGDLIYIEAIDRLKPVCQTELMNYLNKRSEEAEMGIAQPRIVVGTERALSMMVLRKEFSRELFQALTAFAIFLPSLNERPEDMLHFIQVFTEELTGQLQTPPTWLVDHLSTRIWGGNLNDLKKVLKNGFVKNPDLRSWKMADLPENMRAPTTAASARLQASFKPASAQDVTAITSERVAIKQALLAHGGDRDAAALTLGISKSEFLKKIFSHGLR